MLIVSYRYILGTDFGQLQNQPDLLLQLKEHYAIAGQGEGYILYDLGRPK